MMRSMFAGVSGLRNHQIRMDVIGNNIANVNTTAYKRNRVSFQEMMTQTLRGATQPQGERGGTNPLQVGLGMSLASIDTIFTEGGTQSTGKVSDLAIEGNGFFILKAGDLKVYTRAGNFDLDVEGNLSNPSNGYKVQGWKYDQYGNVDPTQEIEDIKVIYGQAIGGGTTRMDYVKNLDSRVDHAATNPADKTFYTNTIVYDSQGNPYEVITQFQKTAENTWGVSVKAKNDDLKFDAAHTPSGYHPAGTITFDSNGVFQSFQDAGGNDVTSLSAQPVDGTGADLQRESIDLNIAMSGLSQFASDTSVEGVAPDAHGPGRLYQFSIDRNGTVTGVYSNGVTKNLYKIAVTNFNNPAGLMKVGDSFYQESNNSGVGKPAEANKGEYGAIVSGALEMSNVDLSLEFTDMIITQRGFQANSRIITASDEMLQELVNLKR